MMTVSLTFFHHIDRCRFLLVFLNDTDCKVGKIHIFILNSIDGKVWKMHVMMNDRLQMYEKLLC